MTNENLKQLRRSDFTPVGYTGIDVGKLDGLTAASRKEAEFIISERRRLLNIAIRSKLVASYNTLAAVRNVLVPYNPNTRYPVALLWDDVIRDGSAIRLRRVPTNETLNETGEIFRADVVYYRTKYYRHTRAVLNNEDEYDSYAGTTFNPESSPFFTELSGRLYNNPIVSYGNRQYAAIKTVDQTAGNEKPPTNSEYWDEIQDLRDFFGFENPSYAFTLTNEYGEESRSSSPTENILLNIGEYVKLNFLPPLGSLPQFYAGELLFEYPLDTIWQVVINAASDRIRLYRFTNFTNEYTQDNYAETGDGRRAIPAEFGASLGSVGDGYKYWAAVGLDGKYKTENGDIYLYNPSSVITSYSVTEQVLDSNGVATTNGDGKWVLASKVNIAASGGVPAFDGRTTYADTLDFVRKDGNNWVVFNIQTLLNYTAFNIPNENDIPSTAYGSSFPSDDAFRKFPVVYADGSAARRITAGAGVGSFINLPFDPTLGRQALHKLTREVPNGASLDYLHSNSTEQKYWNITTGSFYTGGLINTLFLRASRSVSGGSYSYTHSGMATPTTTEPIYDYTSGGSTSSSGDPDDPSPGNPFTELREEKVVLVTPGATFTRNDNGAVRSDLDVGSPLVIGSNLYTVTEKIFHNRGSYNVYALNNTGPIVQSSVITSEISSPVGFDQNGKVNVIDAAPSEYDFRNRTVRIDGGSGTDAQKVAAKINAVRRLFDGDDISLIDGVTEVVSRAGIGEYLRIYRSSTRQKRYVLVGQVPTNQHFFKDYTPSGYETELPFLETEDYLEPPEGITNHIFTSTGRYLVCATNRVYISPVGVTHAFIREIVFPCQEVLGFIDTGSAVVVLTDDRPFVLQLQSNEQGRFTPYRSSVDTPFPCVSAESIVDMGQFGLYASHEGLIAVGSGKLENVTQSIFTERQWRSMDPTKLRGVRFNDFYLGKFEDKAFLFNPNGSPPYFTFVDNFDTPSYNILDGNIYVGKPLNRINVYAFNGDGAESRDFLSDEANYEYKNTSEINITANDDVTWIAVPEDKFMDARVLDSHGEVRRLTEYHRSLRVTLNGNIYRVGFFQFHNRVAGKATILGGGLDLDRDGLDKKLYAFARGAAEGGEWTSPVIMNDNYHSIKVKYGQTDADPDRNEKVTITIYDENGTQIGDPCETTSGEETELPMLEALDKDDVVQRKFYFTISKISEELHSIELMGDKDNPLPFVQFSTGMSLAAPPARTPAQYLKNFIPLRGVVKGVDTFDLPNPDGTTGEKQIVGDKANADDIFFNPINQKWYYLPGSFPRLSNTNKDPYSRLYFVGEQTEADSTDPIKRLYYIDMYKLKQAEDDTPQGHSIASIQISAEETPDRCVCVHYNQVGGKTPDPFSVGGWVGFVSPNARTILDNDNTTQLNVYRYNSRNEILDAANLVDSGGGG